MSKARALPFSLIAALALSACSPDTDEIVLLEDEVASCGSPVLSREALRCRTNALRDYRAQVIVYASRGITGDNDVVVPGARAVLAEMVAQCRLGRTLLEVATDGVEVLHVGQGGLTDTQRACIATFERPGLFLD